jgi:hypothetical protein
VVSSLHKMKDLSHCPSCNAPADLLKDGTLRFTHARGCLMGRLVRNGIAGSVGTPRLPQYPHDALICSACGTVSEAGSFPTGYLDGVNDQWRASQECPTCWAIAEAVKAAS